ncbi:MAG: hypothetical protein HQL04_01040 [Nitrospirae bacterium]|nr:hypothetical protein [Nitrospirota bacterium]
MDKARLNVDIVNFINFLKSSFYVSLDNIYEINELSEKVFLEMAGRGKDMHNEAERVLVDFIDNARKSRDEFRGAMESGFEQIERIFKDKGQ